MRILLVPQKSNYPDPKPCLDIFGQGFPYIAAALKVAGHQVFGLNMNTKWCYGSAPLALELSLRDAIEKYQPDLIGLGGLSADYRFVRDAMLFIRQIAPRIPIVCGGGLVTYDPYYIFPNLSPDFAVIGEGEETIVTLVDSLEKGKGLENIKNIAFWKAQKPVYTAVEYTTKSLDNLPFPDYSPFDYNTFLEYLNQLDHNFYAHSRHYPRVIPITLGRSCPFECTFCCHKTGPKYRKRSVDNALKEITYLYGRYKFNILFIYDELFAVQKERILEFCSKIKKLRRDQAMDFDWTCDLRVTHVEKDILKEMKEAGCAFIGYGFESASPKVLTSMKKKITVEQIINAIKLTENAGIGVQGNFIMGDPQETEETMQETKSFFETWCTDLMINFNYLVPYPGSEVFQYCLDGGIIDDKQRYYDNIGRIGCYKINMTKMPDDTFFKLVDGLCDITAPHIYGLLKIKETSALSCKRCGLFEADLKALFSLRRSLYKMTAACPNCQAQVEYLFPMKITTPDQAIRLQTYCAKCHKRFILNIPKDACEVSETNPVENFYSFNGVNNYVGFNICTYKGHNIFDNINANRIYAIPHFLGPVDISDKQQLNHPDILFAKTHAEIREKIDNKMATPVSQVAVKNYTYSIKRLMEKVLKTLKTGV